MTMYEILTTEMGPITREQWIQNARIYGLACTCKSGYCAKHDPRIQELIKKGAKDGRDTYPMCPLDRSERTL